MTVPDQEYTQALLEQRISEMSDTELAALLSRTRPPEPPTSPGPNQ
jgi:hypothetical protein